MMSIEPNIAIESGVDDDAYLEGYEKPFLQYPNDHDRSVGTPNPEQL